MWQQLHDPDNPENHAAGNQSDWVKHTLWLSGLDALRQYRPWRHQIHLHSCHAGRGVYRIPSEDSRHAAVALLARQKDCILSQGQHAVLKATDCNRTADHYAGSALLCQWWLSSQQSTAHPQQPAHQHQLYEWHPDTRTILQHTLNAFSTGHTGASNAVANVVFEDTHGAGRFDGETHIAESLHEWPDNSILLMDPFSLWRSPKHQQRRARIHRIMEALVAREQHAPAMSLFFAWGRAHSGCLDDALPAAYQRLRDVALRSSHKLIEFRWAWGLHCSTWWLVPDETVNSVVSTTTNAARQLISAIAPAEPDAANGPVNAELLANLVHARPRWRCEVSA